MNIIIMGNGKIGRTLISSLVKEGHNIIAIDDDSAVITELTNIYDIMGVCGNGVDCDVLEEADVENAELFVATTGSDELNMLACFLAKKMGATQTIARIRNPEYNDRSLRFMRQHLDLSLSINPDLLAAQELFNILKLPSAVKIEKFSRRNFEILELKLKEDSEIGGMNLIELRSKYNAKFLICTVQRGEEVFIPDGNFVLKGGDKIGITADKSEIHKLLKSMKILRRQAKSVMILGGSKTAFYLAKMLINAGSSVKIIERDRDICHKLCDTLPKAVIIHGDGAQQELLLEAGLESTDAFVALTGMDEENILISIFAQTQGVPKVISKSNRPELYSMAKKLGLDCVVSPREITSDLVVSYARALKNSLGDNNIETLYNLMDGKAEALEFNVTAQSNVTDIPLRDLKTRPNALIAGIIRGRKAIIPSGEDLIMVGDKVIVITSGRGLSDLTDILL